MEQVVIIEEYIKEDVAATDEDDNNTKPIAQRTRSNDDDVDNKPETTTTTTIIIKRTRSVARNWMKIREFDSASEAESHVKEEGIWRKASKKQSSAGERVEYRCRYGKYRDEDCPAAIYLLYHSADMKVSLFSTDCEHVHYNIKPSRGLDNDSKDIIVELFKGGVDKPNGILAEFRKRNLMEPSKSQLVNFLRTIREENHEPLHGQPTISGSQLNEWCAKKLMVPEDMDTMFVLDYKIDCSSSQIEKQDIKIVMSTKRLLENLGRSTMVQIDAKHKVIWQGYNVILVGTSDRNKLFHPLALSVCQGEDSSDFAFVFSALRKCNASWQPTILLADASVAVTSGFRNTFGTEPNIRLMCYQHVLQDLKKRLKFVDCAADIKSDIAALQLCHDSVDFNRSSQLFLEKWYLKEDVTVNEFLNHFNEEWLKKNQNWYEGAAPGCPSTNEGIEATNATIKKEHIVRERLPVGQFLNNLDNQLSKWSQERNPLTLNCKEFCSTVTILLEDWAEAYRWAQLNENILQSGNRFYICSSNCKVENITIELAFQLLEKRWETFEEFRELYFSIWTIELKDDSFVCSCPSFMVNSKCKHALGLQIRLGQITVPEDAKNMPQVVAVGQKRKRGQPAKTKKALIVQD